MEFGKKFKFWSGLVFLVAEIVLGILMGVGVMPSEIGGYVVAGLAAIETYIYTSVAKDEPIKPL